jgi:hypothetical protein
MQTLIPTVQVRHNSLILFGLPEYGRKGNVSHFLNKRKVYSGTVTPHARKRILQAIDILAQKTKKQRIFNPVTNTTHDFRLSFTTLTIAHPKPLSASYCHTTLLKPYLRYCRKKFGMKDYIWKCELQKRGQIHYHLASNTFMPWETVRWQWNKIQRRAGLMDEFIYKYHHCNPPSTEIKAVKSNENIADYLAKELCKDQQNQKQLDAKIWNCNNELMVPRFSWDLDNETEDLINEGLQYRSIKEVKTEHCYIYSTPNPKKFLSPALKSLYSTYLQNL